MFPASDRRMFREMVEHLLKETTALYMRLAPEERNAPLRPVWAEYRREVFRKWRAAGASRMDARTLAINEAYMMQHTSDGRDEYFREGLRVIEAALTPSRTDFRYVAIH